MARQLRKCIACMQEDRSPKHTWSVADGTNGGVDVHWHYDCHSVATNCVTCTEVVEASNGAQNDDLVEFITGERP
jgi:hypothetical protein